MLSSIDIYLPISVWLQ